MKGHCMCGKVRFEITADPMGIVHCHCRECQYVSGGAGSAVLIAPKESVQIKGDVAGYESETDKGNSVTRQFCGACGTPLFSVISAMPAALGVKMGALEDSSNLKLSMTLWTSSAQPWAPTDSSIPSFEKDPA